MKKHIENMSEAESLKNFKNESQIKKRSDE